MAIVEFLLNLSGAVFLLLFAVRQVRNGIERAHGASFERIITNQENKGLSASINIGMKESTGRYLVRVDSDDYVQRYFIFLMKFVIFLKPTLGWALKYISKLCS